MSGGTGTEGARGIALLGGAFDPPHRSHERIAAAALRLLPVGELRVLPAGDHPHKGSSGMAAAAHRLAMCRLAFAGLRGVLVDDREVRRSGPSFTVDTLAELKAGQPGRPLWFLIGADNLPLLPTWREHHRILALAHVATVPRRGAPVAAEALAALDLTAAERGALLANVLAVEADAVSASELRRQLAAGARGLAALHPAVEEYVLAHHLYGT